MNKLCITLLTALAGPLSMVGSAVANTQQTEKSTLEIPPLVQVASEVKIDRYFSGHNRASEQPIVINEKGASFIKVHFSAFSIPDGSAVLVSNIDKTEVYRYSNTSSSSKTFDPERGENGVDQFSAMSVTGDTAVVTLVLGDAQWDQGKHKVSIDSYFKGFNSDDIGAAQEEGVSTRSTCGVNERRDVMCWANSNPVEFERTRPVARLLLNGRSLCTAWRVGSSNHLFTNNHCIDSQSQLSGLEVWFNYQNTSCGGNNLAPVTKVGGAQILKTDYTLDYTLFTVDNFDAVRGFGYFGLDVRQPQFNERIYIIQHGAGNPKELAIESDRNADGLCRIDDAIANGRGNNTDTGYYCDTIGGSSGSPVLAASTNKAIALHHFGGCTNQGVRMDLIWPQVAGFFGNQIPEGDNGSTDQWPVADFSVVTDDKTANFSNSSYDTDGTISSYEWRFGDGTTSAVVNPSHTYDAYGTYTVTLKVTDNDGLSNTKTMDISVNDGSTPPLIVTDISGSSQGDVEVFEYQVPPGMSELDISLAGDNGDADLYIRNGQLPTYGANGQYDCRQVSNSSNEQCIISSPSAGTYFIVVRTWRSFSGLTLTAQVR